MREYLVYCTYCNEYTLLGRFLKDKGRFEGEYSLLHNKRTDNDELLCRFLVKHLGHHLKSIPNRTDEYSDILATAERFMDRDIDKFVEEAEEKRKNQERDRDMDRGLGQLQLNVYLQMLREERERASRLPSRNAAESQFMLGREEGLKRAEKLLQEWMEKTRTFY